jgi:cytochrome c peroxidase
MLPRIATKLVIIGLLIWGGLIAFGIPAAGKNVEGSFQTTRRAEFDIQIPRGIPESLWRKLIPANNPMTREKVALGEMLYFEKRISATGSVSCALCHDPANAFTDHSVLAIGVSSNVGTRNAPTILNAMFSERLFWDGRVGSLEEQAKQPITNPLEMGMGRNDEVVARVSALPEYRQRFQRAFGREGITIDTIVKAIAAYERTQLSANSPFDRFISGNTNAITDAQRRGWELFKGKAKCIECHSFTTASPFFTDFKFHNTGIVANDLDSEQLNELARQVAATVIPTSGGKPVNLPINPPASLPKTEFSVPLLAHSQGFTELGRYLVTKQPKDIGAFKTPTLRDIELTTPYMHNGSEKTLIDVVRYYNRGGRLNANIDERMGPLHLSDEQMNDLVEFMRALTSDDVLRRAQSSRPQTRTAVAVEPRVVWKGRRP